MTSRSELYAVYMDCGAVMHGQCAEEKWPDGLPSSVTPVFYADDWHSVVYGTCRTCGKPVGGDYVNARRVLGKRAQ